MDEYCFPVVGQVGVYDVSFIISALHSPETAITNEMSRPATYSNHHFSWVEEIQLNVSEISLIFWVFFFLFLSPHWLVPDDTPSLVCLLGSSTSTLQDPVVCKGFKLKFFNIINLIKYKLGTCPKNL